MELEFFDCNASFGMRKLKLPGTYHTKAGLIAAMDNYGIQSALVYHAFARELSSLDGNAMLMREIAGEPRLVPVWAVMPHHTGEFPEPAKLLDEMQKDGVKAVTLFPSDQSFSVSEWSMGQLYAALEDKGIPLIISLDSFQNDPDGLYDLLCNHPKLLVILANVNYRMCRILFPLLMKFKNLHIETSGYKPQDGIEDFCRRFGAERLLFGTNMPQGAGSAAIAMITYADISLEEKKLIASENLNRILGGVKI